MKAIVIRAFRGSRLYLASVTPHGRGFRWTSDRDSALKVEPSAALNLAKVAAEEYSADCAAADERGQLLQPAQARVVIDSRYSIREEFCGHPFTKWVVCFCGEWLAEYNTRTAARQFAKSHAEQRVAILTGVAS